MKEVYTLATDMSTTEIKARKSNSFTSFDLPEDGDFSDPKSELSAKLDDIMNAVKEFEKEFEQLSKKQMGSEFRLFVSKNINSAKLGLTRAKKYFERSEWKTLDSYNKFRW